MYDGKDCANERRHVLKNFSDKVRQHRTQKPYIVVNETSISDIKQLIKIYVLNNAKRFFALGQNRFQDHLRVNRVIYILYPAI